MIEVYGNLWDYPADIRLITTNATISAKGRLVMGRGCASQAKNMFPGIDKILADQVRLHGNTPVVLTPQNIGTFPVKYRWWETASLSLIEESAKAIKGIADKHPEWKTIVLPRPGCGNGRLEWEAVKPIISPYLDDRFRIIDFPRNNSG